MNNWMSNFFYRRECTNLSKNLYRIGQRDANRISCQDLLSFKAHSPAVCKISKAHACDSPCYLSSSIKTVDTFLDARSIFFDQLDPQSQMEYKIYCRLRGWEIRSTKEAGLNHQWNHIISGYPWGLPKPKPPEDDTFVGAPCKAPWIVTKISSKAWGTSISSTVTSVKDVSNLQGWHDFLIIERMIWFWSIEGQNFT